MRMRVIGCGILNSKVLEYIMVSFILKEITIRYLGLYFM